GVTDEWRFASTEPAAKQEVSRSCHKGHTVRNDNAHPRGWRPESLIQRERALDSDGDLRFACIAEIKIAGARCIQTLELALRRCFIAKGLHKRSGEPYTNTKHARARLFSLARDYAISTNVDLRPGINRVIARLHRGSGGVFCGARRDMYHGLIIGFSRQHTECGATGRWIVIQIEIWQIENDMVDGRQGWWFRKRVGIAEIDQDWLAGNALCGEQ